MNSINININKNAGAVIWITGLSGAGKSTIANILHQQIQKNLANSRGIILLDGDELREIFPINNNDKSQYERPARLKLAMSYANLCKCLANQGNIVIIATISLFAEVHNWNKQNLPNYYEIYLKVPLDELEKRDPKKIYQRYKNGEINHVAGLDFAIDEPKNPFLLFDFEKISNENNSPEKISQKILDSVNL